MSGFASAVRVIIITREGGLCARCPTNLGSRGTQIHHRRPRGMGGSKRHATDLPSAGLYVCTPCHNWIERNRTIAKTQGLLLGQTANPAEEPVLYRGEWMLLDDTGLLIPHYERRPERWFCGQMWPSGTPEEPHVCIAPPEHDGGCVCACGRGPNGKPGRRITNPQRGTRQRIGTYKR